MVPELSDGARSGLRCHCERSEAIPAGGVRVFAEIASLRSRNAETPLPLGGGVHARNDRSATQPTPRPWSAWRPKPSRGGGVLSPSDRRFIHAGLAARPVVNSHDGFVDRMNCPTSAAWLGPGPTWLTTHPDLLPFRMRHLRIRCRGFRPTRQPYRMEARRRPAGHLLVSAVFLQHRRLRCLQ